MLSRIDYLMTSWEEASMHVACQLPPPQGAKWNNRNNILFDYGLHFVIFKSLMFQI
jgi:hypothetical protein